MKAINAKVLPGSWNSYSLEDHHVGCKPACRSFLKRTERRTQRRALNEDLHLALGSVTKVHGSWDFEAQAPAVPLMSPQLFLVPAVLSQAATAFKEIRVTRKRSGLRPTTEVLRLAA